jgi:hypothetical protein
LLLQSWPQGLRLSASWSFYLAGCIPGLCSAGHSPSLRILLKWCLLVSGKKEWVSCGILIWSFISLASLVFSLLYLSCVEYLRLDSVAYCMHVKHATSRPHAALSKHTCSPHKGYFNGQHRSFHNLNWINVRRSQKNGMLFFIQHVCMHIVCF